MFCLIETFCREGNKMQMQQYTAQVHLHRHTVPRYTCKGAPFKHASAFFILILSLGMHVHPGKVFRA